MHPDTIVFLIRDRGGRIVVLPTREEAEEFLIPDLPEPGIVETTFGWVLEYHPKALVRLFYQYYWAEELAEVA